VLLRSTVSGNTAALGGGIGNAAVLTAANLTLSGMVATARLGGGGL
jgi:hypothetical protein